MPTSFLYVMIVRNDYYWNLLWWLMGLNGVELRCGDRCFGEEVRELLLPWDVYHLGDTLLV